MSKVILKKSSVTGKIPLATDLDYGEPALNYADGIIYFKKPDNSIGQITTGVGIYQPIDADLTAIAALVGTTGLLKKTAANTWTLDTNTYLTGNQTVTLSGDASGSGSTSIAVTLANSGVTAGTYTKITVDAKGRATAGANLTSADLPTYTGSLTSSQITTGLGFTPLSNATSYLPLTGGTLSGNVIFGANPGGRTNQLVLGGYNSDGGTGYHGFLTVSNTYSSATNPHKFFRLNSSGSIEIINSAYTTNIFTLADDGTLTQVKVNANVITSGTVASARLGSGTADSTTYLRGDGTWATISVSSGVSSFNTRTGAVTLSSSDVTTALGFTPLSNATSYLPLSGGTLSGAVNTITAASSWGFNATTTGYSNNSGIWFSANVGELLLRKADGTLSTRIAADGSYAFINNNNILHAGNYTSYSPSLTGSGASGSWGISVTGSAASVSGLTLTSSSNGVNPDNVTQNQIGYNTSVSLFGQTDGGLYSSAYSSSWVHQIYGDFRTGQIAVRGKNSGTWQAWRYVLDSSNFSSYAVPIRIQTNWNDGTVINNVVGMLGWKNYGSNHVIFDASAGTSPSGTSISTTDSTYAWSSAYPTLMGWNGAGTYGVRVDRARQADYLYSGQAAYATIYYDYSDTSYYCDPLSTSSLWAVSSYYYRRKAAGYGYLDGGYSSAETTATSGAIYTIGGGNYVPTSTTLGNMYGIGYCYGGVAGLGGSSAWGLYVATNGTARHFLDSDNGIGYATGSYRAQVFYDSNNTNYYVDPASTTVLNVLNAVTKSFLIDHPTKSGKKLRYACLEGPENGVYVRGKLTKENTIELPEYWTKLVDPDSITVSLTPIGKGQKLSVLNIGNNCVIIQEENDIEINCFYVVYGERVDVDKLEVEI